MKKIQIPIYKEVSEHFSTNTEADIRKHYAIASLMETQMMMMSVNDDKYEGNHIPVLFAKDILGHRTYGQAIEVLIEKGILTRLGKRSKKYPYHDLHYYAQMELSYERTISVPLSMKKVNNSIDKLKDRITKPYSDGGHLAMKNLQDQRFGLNWTYREYVDYYTNHYPEYCQRKMLEKKKQQNGRYKKCIPKDFEDYKKRYEITWECLQYFLSSDRSIAWRFVADHDEFAHRVYTIATAWPKVLRQHLTYNGEKVSILDLKQSGPTFKAKILDQWHPGNDYSMFIFQGGDFYRLLQERYKRNDDREAAKRIFNIWAYGDLDTYYHKNLQGRFPQACGIMDEIKSMGMTINPKPENYKNLSCMIFQEESRVFRMIWDELDRQIGWFLTCHDEIIVPFRMKDQTLKIMNKILSQELGNIPFEVRPE